MITDKVEERKSTEDEKENDNKKENTLGFSITLTAFYITALYNLYNYSAENLFNVNLSLIVSFMEAILFSALLLLVLSIFTKGYSLELTDRNRDLAVYLSSCFYAPSFRVLIYSIPISAYFYLTKDFEYKLLLYIIISIVIVVFLMYPIFKNKGDKSSTVFALSSLILLMLGLIIYSIAFSTFIDIRPNNIDIEMDSVYELDESFILVSATVTGVNNDLFVGLFQENESNSLNLIEEIKISINTTDRIVEKGSDYLVGDCLNNGNYNIFINTSSLEAGYYELWFNVAGTSNIASESFYFVHTKSSEHS
ncbi:MAG: hypothetical protein SCH66_11135 [Methanolobus sp.]|nr:hypothetical protein [Methanolobus sp.]